MRLNNPISQIRQRSIMGNSPMRGGAAPALPPRSPIGGGQGGFRGLFSQPTSPVSSGINFDLGGDVEQQMPVSRTGPNDRASQFYEEMERLRGEAGPGLTAYREALNQMPTQEEYKPNWMTRIASGLSGFGAGMRDPGEGIRVAQDLNQSSYRNAMSQYSNRLGTLKEQADIEQEESKGHLARLKTAYDMGLDYDKFELERDKAKATMRQGDITAGARQVSADAAMKNASKQDYTYTPVQGGFMVSNRNNPDDPLTGRIIAAKTVQDAQNKVAQQNANSTSSQAATSAGRLAMDKELEPRRVGAAEANAGANVYRALNPRETGQNNVFVQPGAQKTARELAEDELSSDPVWGPMLGKRGSRVPFMGLSQEDKEDLEEAIQDKATEIMNRRR